MKRLPKYGIHLQLNEADLPVIDRLREEGYSYPDIFRAGMRALERKNEEKEKT